MLEIFFRYLPRKLNKKYFDNKKLEEKLIYKLEYPRTMFDLFKKSDNITKGRGYNIMLI